MSLNNIIGVACFFVCTQFVTANALADNPRIVMSTTMGDLTIELNEDRAPQTVKNFLDYVDDGFYENTLFHRVIEGFMIQGGGFGTEYRRKTTRPPVSNEAYNGLRNQRYTIAMARTTAPHSATSQFFINSEDNTNLDHTDTSQRGWGYTVFGKVVQGQEIVDKISQVRTSSGGPFRSDVPVEPIVILNVRHLVPAENGKGNGVEPAVEGAAAAKPVIQQSGDDKPVSIKLKVNKDDSQIQAQPAEQN